MKKLGEKRAWAYPWIAQIFLSTPYYLRNGYRPKATNFRILYAHSRIDRNKSTLKMSGKVRVAVGVLRDCQKFSGHPCIGRIARSSLR